MPGTVATGLFCVEAPDGGALAGVATAWIHQAAVDTATTPETTTTGFLRMLKPSTGSHIVA
jgi:hypothetical protein